jgi:hypothetical protein
MGQRHQVYLRLPGANNRPEVTIGIHHQWLWGRTAARSLANLLKFVANQGEYGPFTSNGGRDAMSALEAIYSVDVDSGYFHSVHPLWKWDNESKGPKVGVHDECCADPTLGDNNNGITVIDLSGEKPKYCFMSVGHLECLGEGQENNYTNFKPIDIDQWMTLHYPTYKDGETCGCETCTKEPKYKKGHDKAIKANGEACRALVDFISKFEVLTKAEIKRIFPKLKGVR